MKLPLGGVLGSAQSLGCCFSAQKAAYSATLSRGYLQRQEWENYGRIHASAKRQHPNLSNNGLEFF